MLKPSDENSNYNFKNQVDAKIFFSIQKKGSRFLFNIFAINSSGIRNYWAIKK